MFVHVSECGDADVSCKECVIPSLYLVERHEVERREGWKEVRVGSEGGKEEGWEGGKEGMEKWREMRK